MPRWAWVVLAVLVLWWFFGRGRMSSAMRQVGGQQPTNPYPYRYGGMGSL